jgi:hypothetical protein
MWICLNDAFLSIVAKDCDRDHLLVRARRKGDIERVFPNAKVDRSPRGDYLYRSVILRADIAVALAEQVKNVDYNNFKDSVADDALHDAYLNTWVAMARLQPRRPYSASGWPDPVVRASRFQLTGRQKSA